MSALNQGRDTCKKLNDALKYRLSWQTFKSSRVCAVLCRFTCTGLPTSKGERTAQTLFLWVAKMEDLDDGQLDLNDIKEFLEEEHKNNMIWIVPDFPYNTKAEPLGCHLISAYWNKGNDQLMETNIGDELWDIFSDDPEHYKNEIVKTVAHLRSLADDLEGLLNAKT